MKYRHICPACGLAVGWHGPSKLSKSKIRAFFFYLWHRSPCFVDCANCGHTISAKEWLKLKRIPRCDDVPFTGTPRKGIHQDYGRFFKGKGKGQHKWYRRSIKQKKQPED